MHHLSNWIEIPAIDLERAKKFYSEILGTKLIDMRIGNTEYAIFSTEDQFNSGALACGKSYKPSQSGGLIYLNGGKDLSEILNRVQKAGGKVLLEKKFLAKEAGFIGYFTDTEGNKIGLQSAS